MKTDVLTSPVGPVESNDEPAHVCVHGDDAACEADAASCKALCGADMSSDDGIEWVDEDPADLCVVCLAMHARRKGWVPEGWIGP